MNSYQGSAGGGATCEVQYASEMSYSSLILFESPRDIYRGPVTGGDRRTESIHEEVTATERGKVLKHVLQYSTFWKNPSCRSNLAAGSQNSNS